MPPLLALFICTIFVLFMLRLDRKQSPNVSFALWIPTVWMLLIASKPLGIWFQSSGVSIEEGSPLDRAFLTVLLLLGLIILVKRKFNWPRAIKENIWLTMLIVYMLVSCLWSDIPFLSFKRWSQQLIAVIMVFIVATEPDPRKALESLFRRIIYITIPFSFILIQYFGEYGRTYVHHQGAVMWTGVTLHKNSLTQLCLFAAFFLVWTVIRRKQGTGASAVRYQKFLEAIIFIVTLWLWGGPEHSFTYSATATIGFAMGLSALIGLYWEKKRGGILVRKILVGLIAFIFIYGTVTPMLGGLSLMDISSAVGRDQTLTGRTMVWAQLVPIAMERPIIGNGFDSFWTTETREKYDISGSHNGYLEVILQLGFVGLLLFGIFLMFGIRKAERMMTPEFDWGALLICFMLMLVIHNIAEASLNTFTSQIMVIILLLMVASTKSISYSRRALGGKAIL